MKIQKQSKQFHTLTILFLILLTSHFTFAPHDMGASNSRVTPDAIDEATARELAGVYWDQGKFEAAKNEHGYISREQFEKEALTYTIECGASIAKSPRYSKSHCGSL